MAFFLHLQQSSCHDEGNNGKEIESCCNPCSLCSSALCFVFHELDRRYKPRLYLSDERDSQLFVDAYTFIAEKNVQIDSACSSRVYTSLAELSRILGSSDHLTMAEQRVKDVFAIAKRRCL